MKDREENTAILRNSPLLTNVTRFNTHQRARLRILECRKCVECLIGEIIAVGQEQNARPALRFGIGLAVLQIPAAVIQLPRQLESNEGFAGTGGQREQHAVAPVGNRRQHTVYRDVLVITTLKITALVLEGHHGKTVTPDILGRKQALPQFIRRRKLRHLGLGTGVHIDGVDALAVAGIGKTNRQLARVILGLAHALGQRLVPSLGLDYGQLGVAVLEHVVSS